MSVDPLATDYASWSGFNYVLGNPVRFVDPSGNFVIDPSFKRRFPMVTAYVEKMTESYSKKPAYFKKGLERHSGAKQEQILKYLRNGSGPVLKAGYLENANGVTNIYSGGLIDNTDQGPFAKQYDIKKWTAGDITIDKSILYKLEHALAQTCEVDNDKLIEAIILFESTLYHELTHYGDADVDGKINHSDYTVTTEGGKYVIKFAKVGNESGKKFEKEVYGTDVNKGNSLETGRKKQDLLTGTPASER